MNGRNALVLMLMLALGCNVTEQPVPVEPQKPDTPVVIVVPAESYFKGLAKWIEAKIIETPREMAGILTQLVRTKQLSQVDSAKLDSRFPDMQHNNKKFTADDISFLKALK